MCMNVVYHKGKHTSFPSVFFIRSKTIITIYFKIYVYLEVSLLDNVDIDFFSCRKFSSYVFLLHSACWLVFCTFQCTMTSATGCFYHSFLVWPHAPLRRLLALLDSLEGPEVSVDGFYRGSQLDTATAW